MKENLKLQKWDFLRNSKERLLWTTSGSEFIREELLIRFKEWTVELNLLRLWNE